ncbi:MAG TPA: DUF533 domain-containing protein [Vicinamibacterales bacterium]|nr:DUF533 domain-containing protein [Vicinamibacterales bacterium]
MNPTSVLVDAVLGGVLGGGRKRAHKARRYLTGGGSGLWSNPAVLMTAAGVAWGVFETLQQSGALGALGGQAAAAPPPGGGVPASANLPPLPNLESPPAGVDRAALRLIRLAISAANADGALDDRERTAIVQQARTVGAADIAERELRGPRALREIVGDGTSAEEAATLYVLAFTVLRADEQLTTTERVYLAQLAALLRLDAPTVEALEKGAAARIEGQI